MGNYHGAVRFQMPKNKKLRSEMLGITGSYHIFRITVPGRHNLHQPFFWNSSCRGVFVVPSYYKKFRQKDVRTKLSSANNCSNGSQRALTFLIAKPPTPPATPFVFVIVPPLSSGTTSQSSYPSQNKKRLELPILVTPVTDLRS